jgi:hypothetical protein
VRERKAFVVLAVMMVVLAVFCILFSIQEVSNSDHKFCQLVTASLKESPVPTKPADPKLHPSRERLYDNYEIVVHLGHSLGCL